MRIRTLIIGILSIVVAFTVSHAFLPPTAHAAPAPTAAVVSSDDAEIARLKLAIQADKDRLAADKDRLAQLTAASRVAKAEARAIKAQASARKALERAQAIKAKADAKVGGKVKPTALLPVEQEII